MQHKEQPSPNMHIDAHLQDTSYCISLIADYVHCTDVHNHRLTPESSSSEQSRALQHSSQLDRGHHLSQSLYVRLAFHTT